jgi:hypothetical protein
MGSQKPPVQGITLGVLALGAAVLSGRSAMAAAPKLLVFLHVAIKQRAFQSMLEGALPGIQVTAVGRVGDFERSLKQGQDALLSLPVVLAAQGLSPSLRGHRQGAPDEKYSLVGVNSPPDPPRMKAVGTLDLLGREGTTTFVHGLLGAKPKTERVTKVEDLLPLLQMQRVDAILMPARLVPEIRSTSRLNLVERELTTKVGLPAVAKIGTQAPAILRGIGKLPAATSRSLGVEEWR